MTTQNSIPGKLCALKKQYGADDAWTWTENLGPIDFLLESAGKPGFVLLWFLPCE